MSKNYRGFAPILLVFALALVGVIVYFVIKNITAPTTTSTPRNETPVEVDTSNWVKYTNDEFAFSLKYPTNYDYFQELPARMSDLEANSMLTAVRMADSDNENFPSLRVRIAKTDLAPEEWVTINNCPVLESGPICSSRPGLIANSTQVERIEEEPPHAFISTFVNYNDLLYEIGFCCPPAYTPVDSNTRSVHNAILSTFQFTN